MFAKGVCEAGGGRNEKAKEAQEIGNSATPSADKGEKKRKFLAPCFTLVSEKNQQIWLILVKQTNKQTNP